MIYNPYEILGVSHEASREEIDQAYRRVREDLRNKRMESGIVGEEAAERLQYLEQSYNDLMEEADRRERQSGEYDPYLPIRDAIKSGDLNGAQDLLDKVENRDAEWHYMQSTLFFKKNWFVESKKQLEIAVSMEPGNVRYTDSLDRLVKYLASNSVSPDQMRSQSRPASSAPVYSNNGTCTGSCCGDMCLANLCANCICGGCS